MRDRFVISLEDILVDAEVGVEEPECGFETLRQRVERVSVEAFVIHAVNLKDHTQIAGFREEGMLVTLRSSRLGT